MPQIHVVLIRLPESCGGPGGHTAAQLTATVTPDFFSRPPADQASSDAGALHAALTAAVTHWGKNTPAGRQALSEAPNFNVGDLVNYLDDSDLKAQMAVRGIEALDITVLHHDGDHSWEYDDSLFDEWKPGELEASLEFLATKDIPQEATLPGATAAQGEIDPEHATTLPGYFALRDVAAALDRERISRELTAADVVARGGPELIAITRIATGQYVSFECLAHYAAALGLKLQVSVVDSGARSEPAMPQLPSPSSLLELALDMITAVRQLNTAPEDHKWTPAELVALKDIRHTAGRLPDVIEATLWCFEKNHPAP